ncbi:MAG: TatD family hydrolase [Gemmatimonadota bacterium]
MLNPAHPHASTGEDLLGAAVILYFDSHCHVQDAAFDGDREAVLGRAWEAGVRELVVIGADPAGAVQARELAAAERAEGAALWWTAGLHPHEASRWSAAVREGLVEHLAGGAVAVGETGLDYHYDHSPRDMQRAVFADQLALARDHDRPVVIHSREAETETLELLAASGLPGERVVLHCFSGSREMLEEGVARGYYVAFSGLATFRAFPAAELVPLVPPERLLAETDALYLAPVPHRGRRNEPAFLPATVAALAAHAGVDPATMAARTRANAHRFYRLDDPAGGSAG